ncbi:hypothetical protein ACKKBG_A34765 [Auxenochlorella protothecoides x Auxenochlorella symbiontica]
MLDAVLLQLLRPFQGELRKRVALAPIIADSNVLPELTTAASAAHLRSELAAREPTATATSALRACGWLRGSYANAALASSLLCAGRH